MLSFKVTSQRTSAGNKAMGGLRGSSKVGTSNANKRAQARRAYGGNFFFNIPEPSPTPVVAPVLQNPIADVTVNENATPTTIDLSNVFTHEGTGTLVFSATSSNTNVVTVSVDGTNLLLTYAPNSYGNADVTVTANVTGTVFSTNDNFSVAVQDTPAPGPAPTPEYYYVLDSAITDNGENWSSSGSALLENTEGLPNVEFINYALSEMSKDDNDNIKAMVVNFTDNNRTLIQSIVGTSVASPHSESESDTGKMVFFESQYLTDAQTYWNSSTDNVRAMDPKLWKDAFAPTDITLTPSDSTLAGPSVKAIDPSGTPIGTFSSSIPADLFFFGSGYTSSYEVTSGYDLANTTINGSGNTLSSATSFIDDTSSTNQFDITVKSTTSVSASSGFNFNLSMTKEFTIHIIHDQHNQNTVSGTHSDGYISARSGSAKDAVTGTQLASGFMTDSEGNYSFQFNSAIPELIEITFEGEGTDTLTGEKHTTPMSAIMTKEDLEASNNTAHVNYMTTLHNELTKDEMEIVKADTTLSETDKVAEMKSIELSKQLKMSECFGISLENFKKDPIDSEDIDAISAAQTVHNTIETIARGIENDSDLSDTTKDTITRSKIMKSLIKRMKETEGKFQLNNASKIKEIYDDIEIESNVSLTKKDNMSSFMAATNSEIESGSTHGSFNKMTTTKIQKGSTLRNEMIKEMNKPDNRFKDTKQFDSSDFAIMKTDAENKETAMEHIKQRKDRNGNKAAFILVSVDSFKNYLLNDVTLSTESTEYGKDISVVDIFAENQPLNGKTDGDEIDTHKVMIWGKRRGIDLTVDMLLELELIDKVVVDNVITSSDVMNKLNELFNSDDMADWTMYKVIEKTEHNCNVDVEGGSFVDPYYDFKVMKQKTLKFDTRKAYTFMRISDSFPFYVKDDANPSNIEILGEGSATEGIKGNGTTGQSFTLSFKDTFDVTTDSLTYFSTAHNDMNKTWEDRKMYYTSKLASQYTILAKTSDDSKLSQWIFDYHTDKLIRKDYDDYWIYHGITLWEDVALEPVVEEVPIEEPISEQERIIIRWEELGMHGDIVEIIFSEGRFTVDMNDSVYGKKRGDPIKIIADVNGEQKEYVYIRDKFQELMAKYESDKSKNHWNNNGTKMPNDIQKVAYNGVVTKIPLEAGYWAIMPDQAIRPGFTDPQRMLIMNWEDHMDKQVEGTRVAGIALILRDRVSFMSGTFVHAKTMEYENAP